MKKTCARCGDPKEVDQFPWKNREKGWRQSFCLECMRLYRREHYYKNPQPYISRSIHRKKGVLDKWLKWLSSHPCVDCGEKDSNRLHCSYEDGSMAAILTLVHDTSSWERVEKELSKCVIRCGSCYEKTYQNPPPRGPNCKPRTLTASADLRITSDSDFHWLVGLLEGEGSFMKPSPSRPNQPMVSLQMTDEDVVSRVSLLVGLKYRKVRNRHPEKWRDSYALMVRGGKAVRLMTVIRPFMGERRKSQIDEALSECELYSYSIQGNRV